MSIDYSNFAFPKQKQLKEKKQYRLKNKSSKLAKLERNRFSILTNNLEKCYFCENTNIELHEVFRGRNRQKSMSWGLVIPACRKHHKLLTDNKEFSLQLENKAKRIFIKKYSEENIEETFDQFDRLDCNITIKLDNYRTNSNVNYTFSFAYIHLMKRDEPRKDDCLLKLFDLSGKSTQINYDLDKALIELPIYYVFEYDIIKQAVINCLQRPEPKIKHKILNK